MTRTPFPLPALAALAFVGLSLPRSARAGDVRYAELHYARDPSALSCADGEELRVKVATRLGYSPFREKASLVIAAHLTKTNGSFVAQLSSKDAAAHTSGARELTSSAGDCGELVESVALAISVVIDPLALTRPTAPVSAPAPSAPAPAPPPESAAEMPPADPPSTPESPPPEAPIPLVIEPSFGVLGAIAAAPAPSFGFTVGAALRKRRLSLGLEGRADLAAKGSVDAAGRSVTSSLLLGALVPCVRPGPFLGCAVLAMGALRGNGQAANAAPLSQTSFYAAIGPRAGGSWELAPWLALEAYADLLAVLTHTELALNGSTVWNTPAVSLGLGIRLAGRIR